MLTPLERRIMRVLWEGGAGNVQKVLQGLTGELSACLYHRADNSERAPSQGQSEEETGGPCVRIQQHRLAGSGGLACDQGRSEEGLRGSVDELLLCLVRSKQLDARKLAELQARLEADASSTEEQE
ncbi:MAG: hypothetical protein QM775_32435 [Pirellulales bacterium]